jgi:hypothetical protein
MFRGDTNHGGDKLISVIVYLNFILYKIRELKEVKWEYSELFSNSESYEDADVERKQLLDKIDESYKLELSTIFNEAIDNKFYIYKKYLFNNHFFLFRELETNIKESVLCLMIGAHTASITNTNLILEKAIKLTLIQYSSGYLDNIENSEVIKKYVEYDKKYSGKNLDQNIQSCLKYNILNSNEANELKEYKIKFRDGYSHFTPNNILKNEQRIFPIVLDKKTNIDKHLMPNYRAIEVDVFSKKNSEEHLKYVLKIIIHLQHKVIEKYRESKKPKDIS